MKKQLSVLIAAPALMLAFAAQAHSEKEHMKTAENPDCAAMSTMDHSKMDMNDPVLMAMMQQCMSTMQHEPVKAESASHGHDGQMTEEGKPGHHDKASSQ
ncbi:hypothetical protein [Amphritea opalescens]|uniref:hypothetical protein n=1 Tax=Amphritea opalescens TaxID=2490544 RepID=UPI0019D1DF20|nr:hypothetical protein [Amphritea opalescens]